MMKIKIEYLVLLLLAFASCNQGNTPALDTPTTGEITINVDESYSQVMDSEVFTFNSLYKYAKVNSINISEKEAFNNLLESKTPLIIVSRDLNADELKVFEKIKITPRVMKVAKDAIAIIVNKENNDTSLSFAQLKGIMHGKIKKWKDINPKSPLADIQIVFDNPGSGMARYMKEKLNNNEELPANCYAVKSNPAVLEYIKQNKNAIGLIGVNWISDGDDPASLGFFNSINVVGISDTDNGDNEYYKPYQAYIAQKLYPLCRDIFIISGEGRSGLGMGFSSFLAGDKGQRIILKSGLMPSTMPVRIINLGK